MRGADTVRRVVEECARLGIGQLTLYSFSSENWKRPKREINPLLRLIGRVIDRELQSLHENGVRLVHIGSLEPLSDALRKRIERAVELTKDNDTLTVCVAFNYGARAEIVEAARRMIREGMPPEGVTEQSFSAHLDTAVLPDPDLVIRTAGEQRLSDFLLWESAYAELFFTSVRWPDFGAADFAAALEEFHRRERRFGGLPAPARTATHS